MSDANKSINSIVQLAICKARIRIGEIDHGIGYIITTSATIANDTIAQGIIDAPAK